MSPDTDRSVARSTSTSVSRRSALTVCASNPLALSLLTMTSPLTLLARELLGLGVGDLEISRDRLCHSKLPGRRGDDIAADAFGPKLAVDARHLDGARHAPQRDACVARHGHDEVYAPRPVPPTRVVGAHLDTAASFLHLNDEFRKNRARLRLVRRPHALGGLDAHVVAAAAGDRDVAAHVLQVERAVAAQTYSPGERLCELRPPCEPPSTTLRLESLLDESRELIGLALDVPCDLVDLTLDLPGDVVSDLVHPVRRLCGRRSRDRDENEDEKYASLNDH